MSATLCLQRKGLKLGASLSLLATLTAGLSGGQLLAFVQQLASGLLLPGAAAGGGQAAGDGAGAPLVARAQQRVRPATAASVDELALELLPSFAPVSKEEVQALQAWTAMVHSPLPPEVRGRGGAYVG